MKILTVGIIGALFIMTFNSNAWAQSGLRVDLGGIGIGYSMSDNYSGLTVYSHNPYQPYQPYPYNYSGYYSKRPYMGWGGYKGEHHHHNHKRWGHHQSSHNPKEHSFNHQRGYKRGHNDQHNGNRHRQSHKRRR